MKTNNRKQNAKKVDLSLLETLYNLHSPSGEEGDIQAYCIEYAQLTGANVTVDEVGNVYITRGNAATFPCFVAHMDEVHQTRTKNFKTQTVGNTIFGYDFGTESFTGIGADDKNGIYVILKMLEEVKEMKAVLFVQEEVGCIGSRAADMEFFNNCRFVIQIDRKGNKDFITEAAGQELCTGDFYDLSGAIKYGYTATTGAMTDVMQLKENGLKIAACNLSAGYYNPHTDNENTNLADLQNCFNLCLHIAETIKTIQPHQPKRTTPKYYGYGYGYGSGYGYGNGKSVFSSNNNITPEAEEEEERINDLEQQEVESILESIIYSDEYIDSLFYLTTKEGDQIIKQVRKVIGYNVSKTTIANVFYYLIGYQLYYTKTDNK